MSTIKNVSKTAVYNTSAWLVANPTKMRVAVVAASIAIAAVAALFNVNLAAACGDLGGGSGGC